MAARLVRTAREAGVAEGEIGGLQLAHALAMEPRLERLDDEHDPHLLHPGRSALVLMLDTAELRAPVLAAALLVESERPDLRLARGRIEQQVGGASAGMVAEVPLPDDEALAELLVTAGEEVRLIALAERLDHLRHAHLWTDLELRRRAHVQAIEVYLPIAERTHPVLARRYAWWCGMFSRRWLG